MQTELGLEYKDKITGFSGTCTGKCTYISGCNQSLLAPKVKKGAGTMAEWFDDQRLERVGNKKLTLENGKNPGCDKSAPIR